MVNCNEYCGLLLGPAPRSTAVVRGQLRRRGGIVTKGYALTPLRTSSMSELRRTTRPTVDLLELSLEAAEHITSFFEGGAVSDRGRLLTLDVFSAATTSSTRRVPALSTYHPTIAP